MTDIKTVADLGPLQEPDITALSEYFDDKGERHGLAYSVMQYEAERQRCYELGAAAERLRWQQRTCRKEWSNVNDPPCYPADKDWKPCALCVGPPHP